MPFADEAQVIMPLTLPDEMLNVRYAHANVKFIAQLLAFSE
jgi:hypothetical protein